MTEVRVQGQGELGVGRLGLAGTQENQGWMGKGWVIPMGNLLCSV